MSSETLKAVDLGGPDDDGPGGGGGARLQRPPPVDPGGGASTELTVFGADLPVQPIKIEDDVVTVMAELDQSAMEASATVKQAAETSIQTFELIADKVEESRRRVVASTRDITQGPSVDKLIEKAQAERAGFREI